MGLAGMEVLILFWFWLLLLILLLLFVDWDVLRMIQHTSTEPVLLMGSMADGRGSVCTLQFGTWVDLSRVGPGPRERWLDLVDDLMTDDGWRTDWPWLVVPRPPLLVITAWLEDGGDLPIKSNPACWSDSVQIWVAAKWLTIHPFLLLRSPFFNLQSPFSILLSPFSIFLPSLRIRLLSTRQGRTWAARTRATNLSISNLQSPIVNHGKMSLRPQGRFTLRRARPQSPECHDERWAGATKWSLKDEMELTVAVH